MPGIDSMAKPIPMSTGSSSAAWLFGVVHHMKGRPRSRYGAMTWRARSSTVPGAKRAATMALKSGNGRSR